MIPASAAVHTKALGYLTTGRVSVTEASVTGGFSAWRYQMADQGAQFRTTGRV